MRALKYKFLPSPPACLRSTLAALQKYILAAQSVAACYSASVVYIKLLSDIICFSRIFSKVTSEKVIDFSIIYNFAIEHFSIWRKLWPEDGNTYFLPIFTAQYHLFSSWIYVFFVNHNPLLHFQPLNSG